MEEKCGTPGISALLARFAQNAEETFEPVFGVVPCGDRMITSDQVHGGDSEFDCFGQGVFYFMSFGEAPCQAAWRGHGKLFGRFHPELTRLSV